MPRKRKGPDELEIAERYDVPRRALRRLMRDIVDAREGETLAGEIYECLERDGERWQVRTEKEPRYLELLKRQKRQRAARIDNDGKVVVYADDVPWGEIKESIELAAAALRKAEGHLSKSLWKLEEVRHCDGKPVIRPSPDRTLLAVLWALSERDGLGDFGELHESLLRLLRLLETAAALEGKDGKRALPDWHGDVARLVRGFWEEHRPGEPSHPRFEDLLDPKNRPGEPHNEVARFLCDVTRVTLGWSPSRAATVRRRFWSRRAD